ncbi:ficolin-2-like [Drosophila innubila]|uniref:ficolin-2-like n=1 Tax=Drosophila innubila TaxID=198719 RepID=UPI00148B98BF|nr:ficolin-2-like [Drosophila innubila]
MLSKISSSILITNLFIILSRSTTTEELNDTISLRSLTYGRSCAEATANSQPSGIYKIFIPSYSENPFQVVCDSESHGGGWTIILRRLDGSEDFHRNWKSYKNGFGEMDGEFFLGLDKIHALTAERSQELLVVLEDFDGIEKYEFYERFAIGDEDALYVLNTLGPASGTAGDSLRIHHGMNFTTLDRDNDKKSTSNCAVEFTGAWWYNSCHECNLTGKYKSNKTGEGINWYHFKGWNYSLKKALMMVRPRK